MEDRWLARAKRVHALATTGLSFSRDPFDIERFEELRGIAEAMLAELADAPVAQIAGLLAPGSIGYATPKVDVRGAVFLDGRILLVRERQDGLWSMPGGYADIGLSASENVVKEVAEEAGLAVSARRLYHLRHKAKGPGEPDMRDFYKLYFLCEAEGAQLPTPGHEVLDIGTFARDGLPPLSTGRVTVADVERAFAAAEGPDVPTVFD
ncbi:MAG: NUDIX hydrolase [Pseudomonadota bacterium]